MKIKYIFIILVLIILIPTQTLAKENLIKKDYINDYADILEDDLEEKLTNIIKKYIKKHNLDIAIVTINTNSFFSTETFANQFYDKNDMGLDEDRNGILLVIDMENREYYILTNGFTHSLINDNRVEIILDEMESHMKNEHYYLAIENFLQNINKYYQYHKYGPPYLWIGAFIISITTAFIFLNKEKKKLKLIKDDLHANYYFVDKEIENKTDQCINTRTSVIYKRNSSSGRSSFGGSSSSGSSSRGGGGRKF